MKKLIIIGAGGLGRMTLETALSLGYICAFVDDDTTLNDVCNTEVLGTIDKLPRYVGMFKYAICAIADNELREKLENFFNGIATMKPSKLDRAIEELELETGIDNVSDYIFWPELIEGLGKNPGKEAIIKKILEDSKR